MAGHRQGDLPHPGGRGGVRPGPGTLPAQGVGVPCERGHLPPLRDVHEVADPVS